MDKRPDLYEIWESKDKLLTASIKKINHDKSYFWFRYTEEDDFGIFSGDHSMALEEFLDTYPIFVKVYYNGTVEEREEDSES